MELEKPKESRIEEETLVGSVEHVVYCNEENGYAVFHMNTGNEKPVVVVGNVPFIGVGESISVRGVWVSHPSYGEQFKVSYSERTMPEDENAILLYLSSGIIRGIGPVTAQRIVDRFGTDTFNVMSSEPELLCEIQGITRRKAESIRNNFNRQLGMRRLMEYLFQFGVAPYVSIRLYKWYGDMAIDFLRDNPYLLTDERLGVSFAQADVIAAELGIMEDSPTRIEAGVIYVLEHNTGMGMCLSRQRVGGTTARLLSIDESLAADALGRLVEYGRVIRKRFSIEMPVTSPDCTRQRQRLPAALYRWRKYLQRKYQVLTG